jgi:hypothetical protein
MPLRIHAYAAFQTQLNKDIPRHQRKNPRALLARIHHPLSRHFRMGILHMVHDTLENYIFIDDGANPLLGSNWEGV